MLIPLICTQCGGTLDVENSQVFESGGFMIVSSDQTFKCPNCGMKYLPGEKINHASEEPVSSSGPIFIGGRVTNSAIIIGNGVVVHRQYSRSAEDEDDQEIEQDNPQPETKATEQKSPKKWWQFWKH